MDLPVFRFAPSPNGDLHLGHAFSALTNAALAEAIGGRFLLRIEDIDVERCTPAFEAGIYRDLAWLGLEWEHPVRRQSEHFEDYRTVLDHLIDAELVYPAFMSRGEVRAHIADSEDAGKAWPRDPDGAPHYPGVERNMSQAQIRACIEEGRPFAWRLRMNAAIAAVRDLSWAEDGAGPNGETGCVKRSPAEWGDVVIARRDVPTSYHLAVVVDDAIQEISHVVRGRDLFAATSVHRLLQELLGLPAPRYFHHDLILGDDDRKLSKSRGDTALASLREAGLTPQDIRRMVGLEKI